MFKALGNPNRFKLFTEVLRSGESSFENRHECALSTLMERLNIGAPTVSHHLKELVNAELLETERRGKFVTCRIRAGALDLLEQFFVRRGGPTRGEERAAATDAETAPA